MSDEPHAPFQAGLYKLRVHAHEHDPDTRTELLSLIEPIDAYVLRCAKEVRAATGKIVDLTEEMDRWRSAHLGLGKDASRLLFLAREYIEMLADIVEARGKTDEHIRRFITEIDDFRAKQGWNRHGFGGE